MNRTDAPLKQIKPFAINGQREAILPTTPSGDNSASFESGFPPITMTLKSAGGLPPKGQNMNQILFELSALCRWSSSGALNSYDSSFASGVSGYPAGAILLSDDFTKIYVNTADGNSTNPNSGGAGWKVLSEFMGLGDASQKNIGEASGNIPDMSYFTSLSGDSGYKRIAGGQMIVWGTAVMTGSSLVVTLPRAFKDTFYRVIAADRGNGCLALGANTTSPGTITVYRPGKAYNSAGNLVDVTGSSAFSYIAVGDAS